MTLTLDADVTPELDTLTLYPCVDEVDYRCMSFAGHRHTPWTWLLEFAKLNDFALLHDPDSSARMQGFRVERHSDGVQVFAAAITP